MKRFVVCVTLIFTLIVNICLIFYWQPQEKNIENKNISKEVVSYEKNLYKIDKNQILEKLSSDDKKDLEKILKKLSTLDMGKIKENFEGSDNDGIIKSFMLIKKRLADDDYKRIEEISSPFLDIDEIHKEMKKYKWYINVENNKEK